MKKQFSIILMLLVFLTTFPASLFAAGSEGSEESEKSGIDVKEIIFHHLGDGYGWEVPFSHVYRIPLPVIVRAEDGAWFCFSSGKLTEVIVEEDLATGKKTEEVVPVIHKIERNGKIYNFVLAHVSKHENKVVELFPLNAQEEADVQKQVAALGEDAHRVEGVAVVDGYCNVDGTYYREYRPWDISITKNVLALFITSALVTLMVMSVIRHYKRKDAKAARKGMGFMEMLIGFIYNDVIKSNLGAVKARKFAPYLLTAFFFIFFANILGLCVIFPGGANLTGNIAVTLVLALLTLIATNVFGKKHYWKEIFWPDVPMFLKFPLPIMQCIELFGIFTKPAALCIRLFANMMGGHMIVITLVCLIFIFSAFGAAALGASMVLSILFTIFMLLIDVLVSFIQAYVFTLLSSIFIGAAQEEHEEHEEGKENNHTDNKETALEA